VLPEVYDSDPIYYDPYRAGRDLGIGGFGYNDYLREPPRVYDEALRTLSPFLGFYAFETKTVHAEIVYNLVASFDVVQWPGFALWVERFDGRTGEYLDRVNKATAAGNGISYSSDYVTLGRSNDLWVRSSSGTMRLLDPETLNAVSGAGAVSYSLLTHFDEPVYGRFAVDRIADRLVAGTTRPVLLVFELASGAKVAEVPLPGNVRSVFLEDSGHAYVALDRGVLCLVDYLQLRTIAVYRVADDETIGSDLEAAWAWDPLNRRVLVAVATPDNADGSATTYIRGFFPRPQPVGLTVPVPLQVPRAGRTVEIATRAFGDVGEGLSGVSVAAELVDVEASIPTAQRMTDSRGYAVFRAVCTEAGEVDLALSTEV
jgi:hypothetical protein